MINTEIWTAFISKLRKELREQYRPYIDGMKCLSMSDGLWVMGLPDNSMLSLVESKLSAKIEKVVNDVLEGFGQSKNVHVRFSLAENGQNELPGLLPLGFDSDSSLRVKDESVVNSRSAAFCMGSHNPVQHGVSLTPMNAFGHTTDDSHEFEPFMASQEARRKSRLNSRFTFDNFITGSSNEMAFCAAKAVAANPGGSYNPLFIYGGVGLGKTHIIQAIGNEILETAHLRVRYMTSEEFLNNFLEKLHAQKMSQFRSEIRDELDVLLLDDIQFFARTKETQIEFFNTFNDLIDNDKQIVLTSDRPPHEISELDDRLRSRFKMGCWTDIQLPEFETRLEIVRNKSRAESIYLPDDVAQYIASKVATNIRELEGCIKRIKAAANAHNERISMSLAQKLIEPFYQTRQVLMNVDTIVDCVCKYFNITNDEIMGRSRKKEISNARKLAMYLARQHTKLSYPDLGHAFNNRDHTTVLSAVQSTIDELKTNNELKLNLDVIERKLYDMR